MGTKLLFPVVFSHSFTEDIEMEVCHWACLCDHKNLIIVLFLELSDHFSNVSQHHVLWFIRLPHPDFFPVIQRLHALTPEVCGKKTGTAITFTVEHATRIPGRVPGRVTDQRAPEASDECYTMRLLSVDCVDASSLIWPGLVMGSIEAMKPFRVNYLRHLEFKHS